nr:CRISPR-associated protein Cas4 [Salipiger pentaromativorans]
MPISALQHWLYCPRQCALIHVERLWAENQLTAEGRVLHARADGGTSDKHKGIRSLRAVALGSERLGLHGVADVVELHKGRVYPVEYKRGRPKAHRADEVQLCAQALCLEDMTGQTIPEGALFYGETRRRVVISFDQDLRSLTSSIANEARSALAAGRLPPAHYAAGRCKACSLLSLCRPQVLESPPSVRGWMARALASDAIPDGPE